jgi:hypothetical protein
MEEQDKIIVLKSFDNPIAANLAKTKLDAYGIPCFLSEENLGNLYPIQSARFSGVRLHLFLKDAEHARQVLDEQVTLTDDDRTRCPRCRSTRIESSYTKKPASRILSLIFTFFFTLFPPKTVRHCRDCDHEF